MNMDKAVAARHSPFTLGPCASLGGTAMSRMKPNELAMLPRRSLPVHSPFDTEACCIHDGPVVWPDVDL